MTQATSLFKTTPSPPSAFPTKSTPFSKQPFSSLLKAIETIWQKICKLLFLLCFCPTKIPKKQKHLSSNNIVHKPLLSLPQTLPTSHLMKDLPEELIEDTLSFLDYKDLLAVSAANKALHQTSQNDLLWTELIKKHLPNAPTIKGISEKKRFKILELAKSIERVGINVFRQGDFHLLEHPISYYQIFTTVREFRRLLAKEVSVPPERIGLAKIERPFPVHDMTVLGMPFFKECPLDQSLADCPISLFLPPEPEIPTEQHMLFPLRRLVHHILPETTPNRD
jgi:hypothetical protein